VSLSAVQDRCSECNLLDIVADRAVPPCSDCRQPLHEGWVYLCSRQPLLVSRRRPSLPGPAALDTDGRTCRVPRRAVRC
jgi:hypothetical protein